MRKFTLLAAAALLQATIAVAQDLPLGHPTYEYGILCDTREQAEFAGATFENFNSDEEHSAAVNAHFGVTEQNGCGYIAVLMKPGEKVGMAGTMEIWSVTVVAMVKETGEIQRLAREIPQWTAIFPAGHGPGQGA